MDLAIEFIVLDGWVSTFISFCFSFSFSICLSLILLFLPAPLDCVLCSFRRWCFCSRSLRRERTTEGARRATSEDEYVSSA